MSGLEAAGRQSQPLGFIFRSRDGVSACGLMYAVRTFWPKTKIRLAFLSMRPLISRGYLSVLQLVQSPEVALYTSDCSILDLPSSLLGIVSKPEVTNLRCTVMLLFIVLSNLMCLLLPALTSAHVTTPKGSVNLAAHHVKLLSTPLKNLLHKRDAILFAGAPNASNALALNSTNGKVAETIPFEEQIDIPGLGRLIYFIVC